MKRLVIAFIGCMFLLNVNGQQDPMFSHYLVNLLPMNPAYAGSRDILSSTLFYRNQWSNFGGAPTNINASAHAPFASGNAAWGVNILNDRIGVSNMTMITGNYAYRIRLPKGKLSFGLSGGLYNYTYNWSKLTLKDENDPVFNNKESALIPNVGAGVFYQSSKFAIGLSAPQLLTKDIIGSEDFIVTDPRNHYFATASYLFKINDNLKFKPSTMAKFVRNAPLQFDINGMFMIKETINLGLSYRTFNEMAFLAQFQASRNFWVGYAYDFPFQKVGEISRGSHELYIGYEFSLDKNKVISPRYF